MLYGTNSSPIKMDFHKRIVLVFAVVFSFYFTTALGVRVASGGRLNSGDGAVGPLNCSSVRPYHAAQSTSETCYNSSGSIIRVGFFANNHFHLLYHSCFDQNRLEVLYVWYDQYASNAGAHQVGVNRPAWDSGNFYPGVPIKDLYTKTQQKAAIESVVGKELAATYVNNTCYLARGHLAAKVDFTSAIEQCATFYLINAAPQWQSINAGNWYWLEQSQRARVSAGGYNTTIYSGTYGVSKLRDQNNKLVDIYLYRYANKTRLPVPLYFYKILYEPTRQLGTAFVTINNPHYTLEEARAFTFCNDVCRNNTAFHWVRWQPDRIDVGYSFCCTVDDFRRVVRFLPSFNVVGLFT